jgi:hypothetical protein
MLHLTAMELRPGYPAGWSLAFLAPAFFACFS